MIIFGKRIPKGNILVLVSFAAISLWLIIIMSLSRQDDLNNIMKRGLYSGNEKWFSVADCTDETYWNKVLPELTENHDDFAVYVDLPDPEILVRGIYVSGEVVIPPMLSGTYFDAKSSGDGVPKMVLGKAFKSDAFDKDGKTYYDYYGTECEVIGIMGTEKDSRINYMIVMDFMTALTYTEINTEYKYDVKDKDDSEEIGQFIYNKFGAVSQIFMTRDNASANASLIRSLFSSKAIMDTVYAMMLISFVVCTMLVTVIWIRKRSTLFKSWELCGYTTAEKMCEIAKRYYGVALSGFLIGFVAALLVTKNMLVIDMGVLDVIQAFGVTVGIGTVILACSIFRKMQD